MRGGVSNVAIARNNTLQINAIGVAISTFETLSQAYRQRLALLATLPVRPDYTSRVMW